MSKKALTDEELFAQFEDIPSADATAEAVTTSTRTPKGTKAAAPSAAVAAAATPAAAEDDDPLAELSALAAARPASRPGTPRLSSTTTSSTGTKRAEHTPASSGPSSTRTSEDRLTTTAPLAPRKSTESTRSNLNQSFVADEQDKSAQDSSPRESQTLAQSSPRPAGAEAAATSGGGWWGSVYNVATAAVKQAEAAVKEIRSNDDVLKYAEQMKGNVKSLREYGTTSHCRTCVVRVLLISSHRRQRPLARHSHLSVFDPDHRSSNLGPRASSDPHNT